MFARVPQSAEAFLQLDPDGVCEWLATRVPLKRLVEVQKCVRREQLDGEGVGAGRVAGRSPARPSVRLPARLPVCLPVWLSRRVASHV